MDKKFTNTRLKPEHALGQTPQFKVLRPRPINHHREDMQKRKKRVLNRGFNSCSDITITNNSIHLTKMGSEMHIQNLIKKSTIKTPPEKLPMLKSSVKASGVISTEASSVPRLTKSIRIPQYGYKCRYNTQVEKSAVLVTKLQEKNTQLSEKIQNYETLMQDYAFLKVNYDKALKEIEELEEERDLIKQEHDEMTQKINDYEYTIESLQAEANDLEQEYQQLEDSNKTLTVERNSLKLNHDNLKQENNDLGGKAKVHLDIIKEQKRLLQVYKNHIQKLEDTRRAMHNQIQDLKGTIRVYCRIRPQLPWEDNKLLCNLNYVDEDTLKIKRSKESVIGSVTGKPNESTFEFVFDKVFQPECSQIEIFEELSQLIQSAIDGYNVCVFAYGQTGSGKTFTMQGEEGKDCIGIIPRSVNLIFKLVDKYQSIGWTYDVTVSFLEIYNEMVRDLLVSNTKEHLEIQYNDGKGTIVKNLTTVPVQSAKELHTLMHRATQNRVVAVTNFNEHSSRSHSVTKISLIGVNERSKITYTGSLSLVDLAGSESAKRSQSLLETKNINKSLSALATVMVALQNKETHIPYRNSKLTYLLQSCLSGNSKTLMFINIAPLDECYSESVNTLRFASIVKEVKISSKKNKTYIK